jgi:NADH-quinone oxidoreductase subunit M
MSLVWLIIVPVLGAFAAWLAGLWGHNAPRWIALATLLAELGIVIAAAAGGGGGPWLAETDWSWIPQLGIAFRLDLDGLSLVLILLTIGLGAAAIVSSWSEITERVGLFHLTLLLTLAGVFGVFLALDLFLFFFFWELMLVPMYFLIALWGHEQRTRAAMKFFIFTQGSGLLMLIAILALAILHERATGALTFDYFALRGAPSASGPTFWIMLGFFLAFVVKLPAFLFHSWLPDAHTEAPSAGSVILAGVLLKTGAYGLLRFVEPLFPAAAHAFAPFAMALGTAGVLYGAVLAFAQQDMKRLVAYSSISHMGFVLLGIFAFTTLALQGVIVQMIAHGISTGALFILVGFLQQRLHTRDLRNMGGLAARIPRLSALLMVFAIASLGLPGLGNFIGEFLILLGSFPVNAPITIAATAGLITAVIYALTLIQRALHGPPNPSLPSLPSSLPDLTSREASVLATLIVAILWLGIYPQPLFNLAADGLSNVTAQHLGGMNTEPPSGTSAKGALPGLLESGMTEESLHGSVSGRQPAQPDLRRPRESPFSRGAAAIATVAPKITPP